MIVECKRHNQVNVMMDGSRKVSLRNRQFVRKIETPMPVLSSRVKPSQFYDSQHDEVVDVQDHQGDYIGVSDQETVDTYQITQTGMMLLILMIDGEQLNDDQGNH